MRIQVHLKIGNTKIDETISNFETIINETPRKLISRVFQELNENNTSVTSVFRVLRFDLNLTPYEISIMQHLKQTDISSRLEFANWILIQDEANFHLNTAVNKQNMRFWGLDKPTFYEESPLHGVKVTDLVTLNN